MIYRLLIILFDKLVRFDAHLFFDKNYNIITT